MLPLNQSYSPLYGPVKSWRFGRSLGLDPIGPISTCSFNCVYCQLGEIQHRTCQRQVFLSTSAIQHHLSVYKTSQPIDVVTVSGSGEPTLALNLGEIIEGIKARFSQPVIVLSNGSLLSDPQVRSELALADQVAIKWDGPTPTQWQRINRPLTSMDLNSIFNGILQFRREYSGYLALQTMVLVEWSTEQEARFGEIVEQVQPNEIQLNSPTRPRILSRRLWSRGNAPPNQAKPYTSRPLNPVSPDLLQSLATRIQASTGVCVRSVPSAVVNG